MKNLKIGDLVYSQEHGKQGIVRSTESRYICIHLEGRKGTSRVNRMNLFVKGDRVDTQDTIGRWWHDNDYCFYAPVIHNPKAISKFS